MGLTSWNGNRVTKKDIDVAKNYLNQEELNDLNRIVTMYLDYADNQARRQISMTMKQWACKLDAFLEFNDHSVLKNAGKISQKVAKQLVETEYEKYIEQRRTEAGHEESDFDQFIAQAQSLENNKNK